MFVVQRWSNQEVNSNKGLMSHQTSATANKIYVPRWAKIRVWVNTASKFNERFMETGAQTLHWSTSGF